MCCFFCWDGLWRQLILQCAPFAFPLPCINLAFKSQGHWRILCMTHLAQTLAITDGFLHQSFQADQGPNAWPWQDMYLIIVLTARNITMAEPTKNRTDNPGVKVCLALRFLQYPNWIRWVWSAFGTEGSQCFNSGPPWNITWSQQVHEEWNRMEKSFKRLMLGHPRRDAVFVECDFRQNAAAWAHCTAEYEPNRRERGRGRPNND